MGESLTDIRGIGIFSKGSKESARFQTDNTYDQDQSSKQAKQATAALGNILVSPLALVGNLFNGTLSGLAKNLNNFASAAGSKTGQAEAEAEDDDNIEIF